MQRLRLAAAAVNQTPLAWDANRDRLLTAIRDDSDVAPHGATFEDGYRCAEVCDAILRSAEGGSREEVSYRD